MQKRSRQTMLPGMGDDPPSAASAAHSPPAESSKGRPASAKSSPPSRKREATPATAANDDLDPPFEPSAEDASPVAGTLDPGVSYKSKLLEMPLALLPLGFQGEQPNLAGKSIYLIDAASLIFQVFHAIPQMTSPKGLPVNAVFGFTRDIFYLIEQKRPDYLFCAFDLPGATIRHEQYEEYKANRDAMPDELAPQIGLIVRMLEAMDVPILAAEGYEADDVLATLARQISEQGGNCVLVTGDKDCRQLINDRVRLYNVRKNLFFNEADLLADWGIRPDQVVDFQALVGDSVDNVPGVPLIGPKIAKELLLQYETLDEVLAHAGEVKGKKRSENLQTFRDQALLSRVLVRLYNDLPMRVDWARGDVSRMDREAALPLFMELGFHGFTEKLRAELESREAPDAWQTHANVIASAEELTALAASLQAVPAVAVRVVGTHAWPTWADVAAVILATEPGEAFYIPVDLPDDSLEKIAGGNPYAPSLPLSTVLEKLRPVLENRAIAKVGHNLKHDAILLRRFGLTMQGDKQDLFVISYLLDAGERNHSLEELAKRYLRHTLPPEVAKVAKGSVGMPAHESWCERVDAMLRLQPLLEPCLEQAGLVALYQDLERPLIDVLVDLEIAGIRVDPRRLAELSEAFTGRLLELERSIYRHAGRQFNIASPKQLQEVLFTDLGFTPKKKTRTGASTEASVLEELALEHELPREIIEYRQYAKLKGTYVDALPAMIHPGTGRVHCSFNQGVAATGRLSSSDPNLQNIPIRGEEGRQIRSAFLPGHEGWKLLAADYSQIELRVLAHYCGDEALCEAFAADQDIHRRVAAEVYGVPAEEVTTEQRRNAKAVNFGIIYGQSPWGLSQQLGIEKTEAAEFIDAYFARYPRVEEFLAKVLAECRQEGYVRTILGRRRAIHGVRSDVQRQRNLPERTAINTVVQGSAADIIKLAMIHLHPALQAESIAAVMLLQIHDELVFEVADHDLQRLADLVTKEMPSVIRLNVPLKVDISAGSSWATLQSLS